MGVVMSGRRGEQGRHWAAAAWSARWSPGVWRHGLQRLRGAQI